MMDIFALVLLVASLGNASGVITSCPIAHLGAPFVDLNLECATLTRTNPWEIPGNDTSRPYSVCTTPGWRFGPRAGVTVIPSQTAAQSLAALLPLSGAALVALRPASMSRGAEMLSTGWSWDSLGAGNFSLYGADGGSIPAPLQQHCVVLTQQGLLRAVNCTYDAILYAACSLQACYDSDVVSGNTTTYTKLTPLAGFRGYDCLPVSLYSIQTMRLLEGTRRDWIVPVTPETDNCGEPLEYSPYFPKSGTPSPIRLWPGDVLRLCGALPTTNTGVQLAPICGWCISQL